MSINSCSINEYTINSLCGSRRQAIINSLRPAIHPSTGGHHPQHVNPNTNVPLQTFRRDTSREEHVEDINTLEQQQMSVTIEMAGQMYSQTLERETLVPVVSVYAVSMNAEVEEQVNISDFTIKVL